jgi:uncharacterized membrane protein (DUF485 family)
MFPELLKLILTITFVLFLPGYFLLRALLNKSHGISGLEKLILSFGISIIITDLLVLLINKLGVPINQLTTIVTLLIFMSACFLFTKFKKKNSIQEQKKGNEFSFNHKQFFIFILLLVFAVFAKVSFLSDKVLPQSTDLGHHMYWSKYIVEFEKLPNYNMPDFIIGEHIIFSTVSAISGVDFISAMPMIILFLVNIFTILAFFILAYQISINFVSKESSKKIALLSLITLGIFYAIASPQAKYVSGGVIGNLLGNLFIVLIFYSFFKAIKLKSKAFAFLTIFIVFGLVYTHHLSTFVFLYVLIGSFFTLLALLIIFILAKKITLSETLSFIKEQLKVFLNYKNIIVLFLIIIFTQFIWLPSYLNKSAIDTAMGAPSKATRIGLSINSLIATTGGWRFFYAIIGGLFLATIIVATIMATKNNSFQKIKDILTDNKNKLLLILSLTLLLAWTGMIFLMSYKPALLKIDIPSGRIASYFTYPTALLSTIGVFYLFNLTNNRLSRKIFIIIFLLVLGTGFISSTSDLSENKEVGINKENQNIQQVFFASEYLNLKTGQEEIILKDHIYLPADTWVKNFLMRDYKNPLSRSLLKRYNDPVKPRETCTRDMIAIPDSETGEACFQETQVRYVMLQNGLDTQQFENSEKFSKIFDGENVIIFQKNE